MLEHANYYKIPDNTQGISLHGKCNNDNPICNFWNKHAVDNDFNYIYTMYKKKL